jgi:hypothetical protein
MNLNTKKYIREHKKIFSLKRINDLDCYRNRQVISWSISKLMIMHTRSLLSCIKNYPIQVIKNFKYLKLTYGIKNSKIKKKALIFGNGPSNGYITSHEIKKFQNEGNETICINKVNLSSHTPNWMVFSDPFTFKNNLWSKKIINFLKKNPSVKIVIPTSLINDLIKLKIKNKFYLFIDIELRCSKNINPLFPRGYSSMTLYKALAIALFFGYKKIGIIGMDNTYPRQIYNDKNNKIITHETSISTKEHLVYHRGDTVATTLDLYIRNFMDLLYFPKKNIFNLDLYSLTDRFKKIDKNLFFKK